MSQTIFTMYAGLHTIGGVIAEIRHNNSRVLIEFGSAYDPSTAVFDGKVEPRKGNWVLDKLKVGLLPKIDGLYRKEDLMDFPLQSAQDSTMNTAVFITHLHLDHMALMGHLDPSVPIYLHHNAELIERALEATGKGIENLEREYLDIVPNQEIKVGSITVLPILCRSTSYCDFAFLISTEDGTIHWTGDLCLHGKEAYLSFEELEIIKKKGVDVLMCDATAFMDSTIGMTVKDKNPLNIIPSPELPKGMLSEKDYEETMFSNLENLKGLCVFNFYEREMDDASLLLSWAEKTGRTCAFECETAYIVYKFFDKKVSIYIPDSPSVDLSLPWMKELLANCNVVTLSEILQNPQSYMVQNTYVHIMELFSLPSEDGVYLHMDGIPIGAFDPSYANMRKIVDKTGFAYKTCFCENYFGHGYPAQVKWFVDQVNAPVLIPCHSYNPERLLPPKGKKQLLPIMYHPYILKNHDLISYEEEKCLNS